VIGLNGRVHERGANIPFGNAENPAPLELLQAKALGLLAPSLGLERARALVDSVAGLEQLADVSRWLPPLLADPPVSSD
jgi:hypothetical protein